MKEVLVAKQERVEAESSQVRHVKKQSVEPILGKRKRK
jgi:hypothetical protein